MTDVNQQTGFWVRVRRRLRIGRSSAEAFPSQPSSSFLPWRRQEAAVANLQAGFAALTQLLVTIRENLEQQTQQQQELSRHLANLSETAIGVSMAGQISEDSAPGIARQLAYQGQQQHRIGNILEKLSSSASEQSRLLHSFGERAEMLEHHDQLISENLQSIGIAMQSVSRNSEQNTQVLQAMRQQLSLNDERLHNRIGRHGDRMTIMLVISMALSALALVAVITLGLFLIRAHPVPHPAAAAGGAPGYVSPQSPARLSAPAKQ